MSMDDRVVKGYWNKDANFALKLNKFVVWPLGLWPFQCDDFFSWFRIIFSFTSQIWMIYVQLMAAYLKCGNASDVVDWVMLSVCSVMTISKIVAVRAHMGKVHTVFYSAVKDWLSMDDDKSREVAIPFAKTGRSVLFFQMGSCYVSNTLIVIGSLPFLMPPMANGTEWNNSSEISITRQLPLKTGCLFGHYRDGIYGCLYAYESVTIMVTAHGNIGVDVFLFSLAMHLCGQIELLKNDILNYGTNPEDVNGTHQKIPVFVQRHCRLLDLAEALNRTVSGMMVVQLILNAGMNLMLGLRVIMAVKNGLIFDALRPIISFNVLMLQLYLISYASDRLSQQAESLLDAIYDSSWYEMPAKLRRDLYFMAMRANKPIYLTAGQFYELSIENFKNILKASFSYFSILRVMFDD